jgi:magnesium-transporting ATPase (P-type)
MAFTTLVLFQLFNTFNARFETVTAFHAPLANRWLWGAVLLAVGLQVAVVHLPFLQRAFSTGPLSPRDWLVSLAVASSVLWLVELKKLAVRLAGGAGGAASPQASAAGISPVQAGVRSGVPSSSASPPASRGG